MLSMRMDVLIRRSNNSISHLVLSLLELFYKIFGCFKLLLLVFFSLIFCTWWWRCFFYPMLSIIIIFVIIISISSLLTKFVHSVFKKTVLFNYLIGNCSLIHERSIEFIVSVLETTSALHGGFIVHCLDFHLLNLLN
jgi:hypothetical protein